VARRYGKLVKLTEEYQSGCNCMSQRELIKSSLAISRVDWLKVIDVSEVVPIPIII
jgi:hypothetical protein